jgi:amino acid transporter
MYPRLITIFAILVCLIGGFTHFDSSNLLIPFDTVAHPKTFILSLTAACRFGIFDFTGYYDVCFMGGEVRNPRRTIPFSCIITCLVVLCVCFAVYLSVIGVLPWY